MASAANFGRQTPVLTWVEPVEVLRMLLLNPKLRGPGRFAYGPEFLNKGNDGGSVPFRATQLHQGGWYHRAQHEIGPENMVLACETNADGVQVTKNKELIFLYLHLASATAPTCFDPSCSHPIAIMPDLVREPWMDDETYYRARARLFHLCIDKVFERFNQASET